ncbi:DUF5064 family protein [Pseudomonas sp. Marseille-Q5115]|uniref:DUF5064 family protein n=1 Tax=Pseudomonas sp. Marseille-Q5115 TaxID=2866593 RepID=UPI001CE4026E|nr:DUF5064 family protein [Pseudomonas sp. Marseille-Q5115]
MFEPGHLHLEHIPAQPRDVAYRLDITYEPHDEPNGTVMHFQVTGDIAGQPLDEGLDLPADLAFNFASDIDHLARQHGMPATQVLPISIHKQYDAMFADIQNKLQRSPGDPVDPAHLPTL